MREYGQVQCSFWADPDVQVLSGDGKLLALYLLTGPHSNGLGCYRLPDGYVQADLGWSSERVSKGFRELFEMGFADRCESTFFVLIPKYLRWNPISNGNVAKARVVEFDAIPKKSRIHKGLVDALQRFGNHWPNGFETLLKGFAEGYAKQDPTRPEPISDGETVCETVTQGTLLEACVAAVAPKPEKSSKRPLPAGWKPKPETVSALAREFGWRNGEAERYLAAFSDACNAKGYRYSDFDAAFRNCVRQDWPKFRSGRRPPDTPGFERPVQ